MAKHSPQLGIKSSTLGISGSSHRLCGQSEKAESGANATAEAKGKHYEIMHHGRVFSLSSRS